MPARVVLHLVERAERVRLFLVRILQLEEHERQPVHVNEHVGPPVILPANRQLVHDAEIVRRRIRPIDHMHVLERLGAVRLPVFLLVAAREQLVKVQVALLCRHALRRVNRDDGLLQRIRRQLGIFLLQERRSQSVITTSRQIPLDLPAVLVAVAERAETIDRRLFKLRLGSLVRHPGFPAPLVCWRPADRKPKKEVARLTASVFFFLSLLGRKRKNSLPPVRGGWDFLPFWQAKWQEGSRFMVGGLRIR